MKKLIYTCWYSILLLAIFGLFACDKNDEIPDQNTTNTGTLEGTGSFLFNEYAPLSNKPTTVFYHVPSNATATSSVLIVFHGGGRDALESRDALITKANQDGTVLVVPEFSQQNFPGGDGYNLGNVFLDGDNPSASTLNAEGEWAFSLIEPLFDYIKQLTGNINSAYNVFGFSAGAQFAHRLLFFKPQARINKLVAAASGWYTMLDTSITFPYGIKESPIEFSSFSNIFSKDLVVLIGESDNDPGAGGLRRNNQADVQGVDRFSRAQYFYNQSNQIAIASNHSFNWKYIALPNVDHSFALTAEYAMDIIY